MSAPIDQLRESGWCVLPRVVDSAKALDCYHDACRVLATCGVIGPAYWHNMTWQSRALELMKDVANPAREHSFLDEPFYLRPAVINDMPSFAAYLNAAPVQSLVSAVLGSDARVTATTLFVHEAGTQRGPWRAGGPFHPDWAVHYPPPYTEAAAHLTLHLLISDFTEENGGILAVPGSHRRASNPGYEGNGQRLESLADETRITGTAGGVIVMDSRLWHATADNPSDFPRVSVTVDFAPSEQNVPEFLARAGSLSIRRPVFEQLPPSVRPLFRHWMTGA